jgi:Peptidase M15
MTLLAPNFDSSEFDVNEAVPVQYAGNVQAVATMLQQFRDMTGSPIEITSCYRDPTRNAATPGAATNSQHLTASAADVEFLSMGQQQVAQSLLAAEAAGNGPTYSQCIFYTTDDHVHIGIVDSTALPGVVGQKLVYYPTGYQTLDSTNINDLSTTSPDPSRSLTTKAPTCQGREI